MTNAIEEAVNALLARNDQRHKCSSFVGAPKRVLCRRSGFR